MDQGTQGELMSATYDRQIITRISDYTSNLLNELNNDLDKEIPKNSSQSLKAAKDITSAAVAFRNFSESLLYLLTVFNDEGNRTTSSTGSNYQAVKQKISGPSSNKPQLGNLEDLANAIYHGTGKPEPLVKQAEYYGVQLAALTAGLNTSLQKLLISEKKDAITALSNLKQNVDTLYHKKYSDYSTDSSKYFSDLDTYISNRQNWEMDQFNMTMIQDSMDQLTAMIETGELGFEKDSLAADAKS